MAKIRVYELARDLNMKNKELLDKLEKLDVTVRSHMSSLDDDTVAEIKSKLRDDKKSGAVEVTRVRPTVIRRRKRTPKKEMETQQPAEESAPSLVKDKEPVTVADAGTPSEEASLETAEVREAEETSEADTVSAEAAPETAAEDETPLQKVEQADLGKESEQPQAEAVSAPKAKKQAPEPKKAVPPKSEPSAKIISRPKPVKTDQEEREEAETAEEAARPPAETTEKKAAEPEQRAEALPDQKETLQPEPAADEEEAESFEEKAEPVESEITGAVEEEALPEKEEAEAPSTSEMEEQTPAEEPDKNTMPQPKAKQKPPKKKKTKKETPAKIIKLPKKPLPAEKEDEAAVQETEPSAAEITDLKGPEEPKPAPEAEKEKGRVKKKRGKPQVEEEKEKKFFKKKSAFKRKEVVEGSALYGPKARKGKKAAKAKAVKGQKTQITTPKAIKRRIKIDDAIVLSDLAKRMGIKAGDMIAKLMGLGVMATVNQTIDFDTAALVAAEFDYEVEKASFEEEAILKVQQDQPGEEVSRPPVVTIMGHVDHGKTSLLDVIRKTRITEAEAGGITQHIGAYHVETGKGYVVFLDTPGHEAFTAMRARGAEVTDIVVLVVAADDGVMPQTIEAINHSKASETPIIVAINKVDKNNAEPDRVQRQLAELGLVPEEWGGETIYVRVSAKNNTGIDDLLEMIDLQAEMLELKANPDKLAVGNVIEAKLDAGRGPVATVLVREGTLRAGSPIVCGVHYGKIRAMYNDRGQNVDSAGPSIPVEILGLTGVPEAGDELVALTDEKDAKQVSEYRTQKHRSVELAKTSRLSLEKLYERMQEGDVKELNLIIKADVHGSIEALKDSLTKLSNEEVKINVGHAATGTITESDVSLAAVSDAIIIGFNVRPSPKVMEYAQEENVEMKFYNVIYNAIKDVKDAIVGMMESTFEDRTLGRAEVRQIFHVPKVGVIAGCYVTDGKIQRNKLARLLRDGVVIFEGKISSLKRYKDDHKEVHAGYECGIGLENYNDIKVGDILECYYMEEIRPELE